MATESYPASAEARRATKADAAEPLSTAADQAAGQAAVMSKEDTYRKDWKAEIVRGYESGKLTSTNGKADIRTNKSEIEPLKKNG